MTILLLHHNYIITLNFTFKVVVSPTDVQCLHVVGDSLSPALQPKVYIATLVQQVPLQIQLVCVMLPLLLMCKMKFIERKKQTFSLCPSLV